MAHGIENDRLIGLDAYNQRSSCNHWEAVVNAGNAIAIATKKEMFQNGYAYQSAAAQNDEFQHEVQLAAGTYSLHVLGMEDADCGIITWYLDSTVIVASEDWYNAAITYNVKKTTTSISVSTAGVYALKGKVASKNAGSSDYAAKLLSYWLEKTA
jgi:hypothetical protein